MRRSFSRGRRFRRKRSVAWLPGVTGYDLVTPATTRLMSLAQVSVALYPNVWGAAIGLTTNTDLTLHGGEDAVMTRIVGRLNFSAGRRDTGAGFAAYTFVQRVLVAQTDTTDTGSVMPFEYLSSNGLGNDDIMYFSDVIVPGTSVLETTGPTSPLSQQNSYWLDIDVSVKRKVDSNRHIVLWFQTAELGSGGGATVGLDFRLFGGLRLLMTRPV